MGIVAIVTDSASCMPQEIKTEYQIEVVPLNIHTRDKTYQDSVDITPRQVYSLLRADETVTTSAPPPGTLIEVFHRLAEKAREVLCLTVASSYSATFSSMQSAIDMAKKQLPKLQIELVDCFTGSAAQALITLTAVRASRLGSDLSEVITRVHQAIPRVEITLVLDTLKYLERGGRAPKAGAWATSFLKLKPVATDRMGHAHLLGMVRSRAQGIDRLLKAVRQQVGLKKLSAIVVHSELEDEARELERRLLSEFDCRETYVTEVSAVVAAHTGPGAIGIAFSSEG